MYPASTSLFIAFSLLFKLLVLNSTLVIILLGFKLILGIILLLSDMFKSGSIKSNLVGNVKIPLFVFFKKYSIFLCKSSVTKFSKSKSLLLPISKTYSFEELFENLINLSNISFVLTKTAQIYL